MTLAGTTKGYRSTEFWLATAASLAGILLASGVFGEGSYGHQLLGTAMAVLSSMGYSASRAVVKASVIKGDTVRVLNAAKLLAMESQKKSR